MYNILIKTGQNIINPRPYIVHGIITFIAYFLDPNIWVRIPLIALQAYNQYKICIKSAHVLK